MLPPLLVLTDRSQLPARRSLVETVTRCAAAGLEAVVLRELDLPEGRRTELAAALAEHVSVITSRSLLPGADGVHLGSIQTRFDLGSVRFHGRSCHDVEDVRRAADEGAAYVTISPVATSASKPGYGPALGTEGVRRAVVAAGTAQVFALGGVDVTNAAAMRAAGADGVAVMGAVMRADDPAAVVARLLAEVA